MKVCAMNMKMVIAAITLAVSVVASLITILLQGRSAPVCHYDGDEIMSVYEVEIKQKEGEILRFCSVYCAQAWFKENNKKVASVTVTDEFTGEKLDVSIAFFVESDVVSVAATRNRIHVFKDEHNAQEHVKQYNGKILQDPFDMN
jgi:hypothetical protein